MSSALTEHTGPERAGPSRTPVAIPEVLARLDTLDMTAERLDKMVATLAQRLEAVLVPPQSPLALADSEASEVPLARRIYEASERVNASCDRLGVLMDRLAI